MYVCKKTRLIERNLVPLIDEINMNYNYLANNSIRSFIPYVNILLTIRTNIPTYSIYKTKLIILE